MMMMMMMMIIIIIIIIIPKISLTRSVTLVSVPVE